MSVALAFDRVDFAYRGGPSILEDVTLGIAPGEFVAIAGPNGGGKTTLLRLALGLERPTRGTVLLLGRPPAERQRGEVAYLAQRGRPGIGAPITVRELVASGQAAAKTDRAAVDEALERVGLTGSARQSVHRLSGGQQQRALIARALAARPRLLVLDEPTTGVDVAAQEELALLLGELHRDLRATILYVSHELGAIEPLVERLLLVNGRIAFDGPPHSLPAVWHDPSHPHA